MQEQELVGFAAYWARWGTLTVTAGIAFVTAAIGGIATDVGPWYKRLRQPALKPPDWAFGPAWTTIFTLIAIATARVWDAAPPDLKLWVLLVFGLNALLNAAWSVFYFTLKRPDLALIEVVLFWCSIVAMVGLSFYILPGAGWLLLPYLVWVSFAAWLNWQTVRLNPPFGKPDVAHG